MRREAVTAKTGGRERKLPVTLVNAQLHDRAAVTLVDAIKLSAA